MVDNIAYDCEYLKYINNVRLTCSNSKRLSLAKDGGVDVRHILKGETPKVCQSCSLYVKGTLLCA